MRKLIWIGTTANSVRLRFEHRRALCRFLDAGGINPLRRLGRPASKKRQGTKSRGGGPRLDGLRYGDFRLAEHSMEVRRRRRDLHACARRGVREGKKRPDGGLNGINGRRSHELP